jgi:MFS family permease
MAIPFFGEREHTMKAHLFLPLKVRSFRLLMTGQIFSDLGNWLDFIALNAILVFQWKMGPGEMGLFLVVFGLPWIVCGPLLAVWSDRYPRKTIMICCDIARMLLVLGLYWVDNYSLLLLLVFLKGTCGAMFDPARQGMIRSTVPADLLNKPTRSVRLC